ncbi:hypothetical protein MUK42_07977 [Musa troglodytarum]|uniref:Ribosomal protein S3 n=1 Tax=Musa troglodytarum TaxID=320322 RepID=A0A9E7HUR3_9LILI|nr:hypothetical protein MUK42_07977 [Musa troglodytarum]
MKDREDRGICVGFSGIGVKRVIMSPYMPRRSDLSMTPASSFYMQLEGTNWSHRDPERTWYRSPIYVEPRRDTRFGLRIIIVYGEKGRRILELTSVVQKRFNFPENGVNSTPRRSTTVGFVRLLGLSFRYKLLGGELTTVRHFVCLA